MNLFNLGREQIETGALDDMLRQVGINDVNSFVKQFRQEAKSESSKGNSSASSNKNPQSDFMSMGSSFLNQLSGNSGKKSNSSPSDLIGGAMSAYQMFSSGKNSNSNNSNDMFGSAINAYKTFSGNKSSSGGASSGGLFDNIGATLDSAQQMQSLLKQLDRNGDGKITVEDIQLILNSLGLGAVSPHVSKALFKAIDQNKNGQLDLTDVMALAAIVNKLNSRFGSAAKPQTQ